MQKTKVETEYTESKNDPGAIPTTLTETKTLAQHETTQHKYIDPVPAIFEVGFPVIHFDSKLRMEIRI